MTMPAPFPNGNQIVALPVEQLALHLLWLLTDRREPAFARIVIIADRLADVARDESRLPPQAHSTELLSTYPQHASALAEAWEWLISEGLLAHDAQPHRGGSAHPDACFVTRRGRDLERRGTTGLAHLRATRRLGMELHPRLASDLRALVEIGAFEEAAFRALRATEVRVRSLAGPSIKMKARPQGGKALMLSAFAPDRGPLSDPDPDVDRGEREGEMYLFASAFSAFRNPLGHREVGWDDPTEAAEVVLFADMLMRRLDRVEERVPRPAGRRS